MTIRKAVPKKAVPKQPETTAVPQPSEPKPQPVSTREPTLHELNQQQRLISSKNPPIRPVTAPIQIKHKPANPPPIVKKG